MNVDQSRAATLIAVNPLYVKLCVPEGLEHVLEGLAREVLRRQPSNIYKFAATYFHQLLQLRKQIEEDTGCNANVAQVVARGKEMDIAEDGPYHNTWDVPASLMQFLQTKGKNFHWQEIPENALVMDDTETMLSLAGNEEPANDIFSLSDEDNHQQKLVSNLETLEKNDKESVNDCEKTKWKSNDNGEITEQNSTMQTHEVENINVPEDNVIYKESTLPNNTEGGTMTANGYEEEPKLLDSVSAINMTTGHIKGNATSNTAMDNTLNKSFGEITHPTPYLNADDGPASEVKTGSREKRETIPTGMRQITPDINMDSEQEISKLEVCQSNGADNAMSPFGKELASNVPILAPLQQNQSADNYIIPGKETSQLQDSISNFQENMNIKDSEIFEQTSPINYTDQQNNLATIEHVSNLMQGSADVNICQHDQLKTNDAALKVVAANDATSALITDELKSHQCEESQLPQSDRNYDMVIAQDSSYEDKEAETLKILNTLEPLEPVDEETINAIRNTTPNNEDNLIFATQTENVPHEGSESNDLIKASVSEIKNEEPSSTEFTKPFSETTSNYNADELVSQQIRTKTPEIDSTLSAPIPPNECDTNDAEEINRAILSNNAEDNKDKADETKPNHAEIETNEPLDVKSNEENQDDLTEKQKEHSESTGQSIDSTDHQLNDAETEPIQADVTDPAVSNEQDPMQSIFVPNETCSTEQDGVVTAEMNLPDTASATTTEHTKEIISSPTGGMPIEGLDEPVPESESIIALATSQDPLHQETDEKADSNFELADKQSVETAEICVDTHSNDLKADDILLTSQQLKAKNNIQDDKSNSEEYVNFPVDLAKGATNPIEDAECQLLNATPLDSVESSQPQAEHSETSEAINSTNSLTVENDKDGVVSEPVEILPFDKHNTETSVLEQTGDAQTDSTNFKKPAAETNGANILGNFDTTSINYNNDEPASLLYMSEHNSSDYANAGELMASDQVISAMQQIKENGILPVDKDEMQFVENPEPAIVKHEKEVEKQCDVVASNPAKHTEDTAEENEIRLPSGELEPQLLPLKEEPIPLETEETLLPNDEYETNLENEKPHKLISETSDLEAVQQPENIEESTVDDYKEQEPILGDEDKIKPMEVVEEDQQLLTDESKPLEAEEPKPQDIEEAKSLAEEPQILSEKEQENDDLNPLEHIAQNSFEQEELKALEQELKEFEQELKILEEEPKPQEDEEQHPIEDNVPKSMEENEPKPLIEEPESLEENEPKPLIEEPESLEEKELKPQEEEEHLLDPLQDNEPKSTEETEPKPLIEEEPELLEENESKPLIEEPESLEENESKPLIEEPESLEENEPKEQENEDPKTLEHDVEKSFEQELKVVEHKLAVLEQEPKAMKVEEPQQPEHNVADPLEEPQQLQDNVLQSSEEAEPRPLGVDNKDTRSQAAEEPQHLEDHIPQLAEENEPKSQEDEETQQIEDSVSKLLDENELKSLEGPQSLADLKPVEDEETHLLENEKPYDLERNETKPLEQEIIQEKENESNTLAFAEEPEVKKQNVNNEAGLKSLDDEKPIQLLPVEEPTVVKFEREPLLENEPTPFETEESTTAEHEPKLLEDIIKPNVANGEFHSVQTPDDDISTPLASTEQTSPNHEDDNFEQILTNGEFPKDASFKSLSETRPADDILKCTNETLEHADVTNDLDKSTSSVNTEGCGIDYDNVTEKQDEDLDVPEITKINTGNEASEDDYNKSFEQQELKELEKELKEFEQELQVLEQEPKPQEDEEQHPLEDNVPKSMKEKVLANNPETVQGCFALVPYNDQVTTETDGIARETTLDTSKKVEAEDDDTKASSDDLLHKTKEEQSFDVYPQNTSEETSAKTIIDQAQANIKEDFPAQEETIQPQIYNPVVVNSKYAGLFPENILDENHENTSEKYSAANVTENPTIQVDLARDSGCNTPGNDPTSLIDNQAESKIPFADSSQDTVIDEQEELSDITSNLKSQPTQNTSQILDLQAISDSFPHEQLHNKNSYEGISLSADSNKDEEEQVATGLQLTIPDADSATFEADSLETNDSGRGGELLSFAPDDSLVELELTSEDVIRNNKHVQTDLIGKV